jgi:bifunctional DNase/RNase
MREDMLHVHVKGVAIPSEDSAPVVILEEVDGSRDFAVTVGAAEAGAILMELEGISTPRPMTHELMAQMFREQGLSIKRVELYGLYGAEEDGFLARLEYGKGLRNWTRDVRPSDALALAVAASAPVYAHQSLFSGHGMSMDYHISNFNDSGTHGFMESGRAWKAPL